MMFSSMARVRLITTTNWMDTCVGGYQQKGIKLNAKKLEYKCKEIPFLGHLLTTEDLKPDPEKVRATVEMHTQRTEVIFMPEWNNQLPHMSDVMKPL